MLTIYTIGHSTRSQDELLELLQAHGVGILADIRAIPRSRRHPHFGGEQLAGALAELGWEYVHLPGLGGLRRPGPDSPNSGWRNTAFRGYADHMASDEFKLDLEALLSLAERGRVAAMCAEAVPWRCHRSLLADALVVRRIVVEHILSTNVTRPHQLTPFARIDGQQVSYPAVVSSQLVSGQ